MRNILLFVVAAIVLVASVSLKIIKEVDRAQGFKAKWKAVRSFGWVIVSMLVLIASLFY